MIMLCHWRTGILPRNCLRKRSQRRIVLLTTESQDSVIILSPCQVKRSNCCMQSRCLVMSGSLAILIVFGQDSRKICERGVPGNFYLTQPPHISSMSPCPFNIHHSIHSILHGAWRSLTCPVISVCVILARTFLPKICL